ncbi:MAG: ribosome silencing factor [Clostridiales bacterium]|jgi:ribosome-associated protein|nr:ribosome silencing factor [Clostridiales bacterium]
MVKSKELALKIADVLNRKGAADITILEVDHLTSITDFFVIASGRNVQAVRSLAEDVEEKLDAEGIPARRREGLGGESRWVVLDYAHVIVHVFHPEERDYYNIERLWMDGSNQIQFEVTA